MALHRFDDGDLPPIPPEVMDLSDDDAWLDQMMPAVEVAAIELALSPAEVATAIVNGTFIQEGDETLPPQATRWRPTDLGSAEWAMAHVVTADRDLAQLRAQADEWAARIEQWFQHRAKSLEATKAFFSAHLEAYALAVREQDPKSKSLVLPSGAVRTTIHKPRPRVLDEQAVIDWAERHLSAAEVTDIAPPQPRKVYLNPLRDHVQVVEVIDQAQVVLANSGEIILWSRALSRGPDDGWYAADGIHYSGVCPKQGDGWPTPDEATDIVARVEVVSSHLDVVGPDGQPVPGTDVDPGGVTAKVIPERP